MARRGAVRWFKTKDSRTVLLRPLNWDDLDRCLAFANSLVEEHEADPQFGTMLDKPLTREQEARWLADTIVRIEAGDELSVAADLEGKLVANSSIRREEFGDTTLHGHLGIAVAKEYRGKGIGTEMVKLLLEHAKAAGLKTVELRCLATNENAIKMYETAGFKKVGVIPGKIRRKGGVVIDELVMAVEL